MKNENKIYVFFSAMAGLMTNYFFVAALYQKSGIIEAYSPLRAVIWGNTIVWAIIACLCYKNIIRRDRIRNILFSLSFIQMLFILTVCADRLVGFLIRSQTPSTMHDKNGLIFDADISARYKTNEIDFEVKTNSLGLRNEEIATTRSGNTRIVCLGDSWTMGWGVNLEQSWPKVMERYLIEQ